MVNNATSYENEILKVISQSSKDKFQFEQLRINWWAELLSIAVYFLLLGLLLCIYFKIDSTNMWNAVVVMSGMALLSIMFVWWMKYLKDLMDDRREEEKRIKRKVNDTYFFLVEMKSMLYKAECDKTKKSIEK